MLTHAENEEKPSYHCSQCDEFFSSKKNILTHMRIHNEEEQFQCSHCDKVFATSISLHRHSEKCIDIKPYQCSECDQSFFQNTLFIDHMMTHSGDALI